MKRKDVKWTLLLIALFGALLWSTCLESAELEQTGKVKATLKLNPEADNVTEYRLYMSDASGVYDVFNPVCVMDGTQTVCEVSDLIVVNGGTYYFVYRAVNADGVSLPSNELSKTFSFPGAPDFIKIEFEITIKMGG